MSVMILRAPDELGSHDCGLYAHAQTRVTEKSTDVVKPEPGAEGRRSSAAGRATPGVVVSLVVIGWCLVFGALVYLRQARFQSFDFDMGIFDQALWLLAHGHSFITVRGLAVFGQHASIAFYLLVPFYWPASEMKPRNLIDRARAHSDGQDLHLVEKRRPGHDPL